MAIARSARWSLRLEQAEFSRLFWAFAVSVVLHAAAYGTYHANQKYHLTQYLHWPTWLKPPAALAELLKPKIKLPPPQPREIPLIFVSVSPAQATAEPPKEAKFYSDKNSVAANPQAGKITETPKIDGKQAQVPKTEDVSHDKFLPLQPSPPTPKPQVAQEEMKPKPAYTPGDLTLAKPAPTPRPTEGDANEAKPARPRTVREALARQRDSRMPGEKMMQEGGVQRRREIASLDTKATPFGAYDSALVDAVSHRWWGLLDAREYASDSRGKVVLQFRLHYDGRITDMSVSENTAGEVLALICQKAVLDPAPYATWPSDMRRTLGDTRNIQFTFYYN
jgi:hypothetical protein